MLNLQSRVSSGFFWCHQEPKSFSSFPSRMKVLIFFYGLVTLWSNSGHCSFRHCVLIMTKAERSVREWKWISLYTSLFIMEKIPVQVTLTVSLFKTESHDYIYLQWKKEKDVSASFIELRGQEIKELEMAVRITETHVCPQWVCLWRFICTMVRMEFTEAVRFSRKSTILEREIWVKFSLLLA